MKCPKCDQAIMEHSDVKTEFGADALECPKCHCRIVDTTCGKPRWVVQHELDTDPTCIIESETDPEGDAAVEFSSRLPWQDRLKVAHIAAAALNELRVFPTRR